MKDIVDTWRLNAKEAAAIATAVVAVATAVIEISDCRRDKKLKRSDPDKYWGMKNEKENAVNHLFAMAANKFADFIIDINKN